MVPVFPANPMFPTTSLSLVQDVLVTLTVALELRQLTRLGYVSYNSYDFPIRI